jgi:hypothetical protein
MAIGGIIEDENFGHGGLRSGWVMLFISPSFRGDAKHRTRNLEIPGLALCAIPE